MQKNISKESKEEKYIPNFIDLISSVVINMYSNPQVIPKVNESMGEEANFIVEEFIKAYNKGIDLKEYDLVEYLGIPNIEVNDDDKTVLNEKKSKLLEENDISYLNEKNKNLKEVCENIFTIIEKYYKKNYKKFWNPGLKHYAVTLWYIIYSCADDIEKLSKEYNIQYVEDGEQRCLFNYFNLYIHCVLFSGEIILDPKVKKVIFAASAIHPAQDDYIDRNEVSSEIIDIVTRSIKGEEVECGDSGIKSTLDLIRLIYEEYQPDKHPGLVTILLELNKWQAYSLEQKKKSNIKEDELLKISFMKGGYAFAFYGYIALGRMSMTEFRHFFGMGAIFQIMDDLHDIEIDLNDNVETIWTKRINNNTEVDDAMYGIIGVQREFEKITNAIQSLKRPVFLRRMELLAVRLDLTKFYLLNRKYFSDEILKNFENKYNVKVEQYLDEYQIKLDSLKTINDFKKALIDIKDSYIKVFLNRKNNG